MGRWVGEETPRLDVEVERAKLRCRSVIDRITTSIVPVPPKPPPSDCYRTTLLRLAHSELSFLSSPRLNPTSLSSNIGHIEAILHILEQPFINGVSRVCKRVPTLSPLVDNNGHKTNSNSKKIHVDIVCTVNGSPVWFLVSARNPRFVSWNSGPSSPAKHQKRNLRTRIQQLLDAATHCSPSIKPSSIILYFSNGLEDHIHCKLKDEFGASEFGMEFSDICFDSSVELGGDWVYLLGRLHQSVRVLEVKVGHSRSGSGSGSGSANPETESVVQDSHLGSVSANKDFADESIALDLGASFCHLISRMNLHPWDVKDPELAQKRDFCEANLINFDTTALIALISGISSSGTDKILAKPERLRQRFKGNYEFVIAQVVSEIQNPIHMELDGILSGKRGMICRSVYSEFKELVSMCGGPNEKSRADHLLNHLMVVPDCPSERMMSLPTTRKLALKNKIVFGTGDYWRAPTLTANMGFVRAVSQTGMSLFTIEHRPRALTGD